MQAQLKRITQQPEMEVSREDLALIIVNARKFAPQAISKDGSGSETSITRVDTAIYSTTDKDSEMYIAPMDGSYIRDGEFSTSTLITPRPTNSLFPTSLMTMMTVKVIKLPMSSTTQHTLVTQMVSTPSMATRLHPNLSVMPRRILTRL